jgi:riboflavin kinase/FMN adenylyltransferase
MPQADDRRIDGAADVGAAPGTTLVAIGNFDGVHRGHQSVLGSAAAEARQSGLAPLILTFHPHPARVLGRGSVPVLTPLERKIELIARIDPALRVVVEPFTLALASKTPRQFAEELLMGLLGARVVIVGENFRFGHGRAGDLQTLRALGAELGFEARAEEMRRDESGPLSSTRIRDALDRGDLATVERLLSRPHALTGRVVKGDQLGRKLGVPTANLFDIEEALPPYGVYATVVDRIGDDRRAQALALGAASIGVRPTVDGSRLAVEVHLLDFAGDLYGATLRMHLVARLRPELRFEGLDALVAQMQRDIAETRRILAQRSPDPNANGAWY